MKIGIISDTHDHEDHVRRAIEVFAEHKVATVLHAGDIVSPFTAKVFAEVAPAKFIAVFGNNDGERIGLKNAIEGFGGEIHADAFKGIVGGKSVYMTHVPSCLAEVVKSQMHDLVIYGHTHAADVRQMNRTLVVNPGESTSWLASRAQVAIVDLSTMECQLVPLG